MSSRIAPLARTARRQAQINLRAPALRRHFAEGPKVPPPPPPRSSNVPIMLGALGALAAGTAYYFYGTAGTPQETAMDLKSKAKGLGAAAEGKLGMRHSQADYQKVYDRIAEMMDKEDHDDGSLAPVLVRLAWHASGTYDARDNTGGSNYATMRFPKEAGWGANKGLDIARQHLEPIKQEFPWISYGDLWTLAGVCAIAHASGPNVPWRPGRIDGYEHHDTLTDGRLPDAAQAQDHLRTIFYRMGFNDQEIVALSGAHALGRCHTDRSGFDGPWQFSPTTFSNEYFRLLVEESWVWRQWKGPKQLTDATTKTLMMLPTDMCLIQDKSFKQYATKYAKSEDEFFKDFSAAFNKLIELGVPSVQFTHEPWIMGGQ